MNSECAINVLYQHKNYTLHNKVKKKVPNFILYEFKKDKPPTKLLYS